MPSSQPPLIAPHSPLPRQKGRKQKERSELLLLLNRIGMFLEFPNSSFSNKKDRLIPIIFVIFVKAAESGVSRAIIATSRSPFLFFSEMDLNNVNDDSHCSASFLELDGKSR